MPKGNEGTQGETDGGRYKFDTELFMAKIKTCMAEHDDMTQERLAELSGIDQGTISKYINGHREPKATAILSLSIALEIPTDELLAREKVRRRYARSTTPIPESSSRASKRTG